ncbi:sensor histidine kinase [Dactylosporangium sp. McL0621]|uniref:sensor histidine kinase n=1 Tax=Dactylosporangium sp. McL0621 TaxID=3415678 RepID=UPI003CF57766
MVRHRQATAAATRTRTTRTGTIRGRLARILALPMVAVLVLLAVVVSADYADYRAARQITDQVPLVLEVQTLAQQLQEERGLTTGLLGGNVSFKPEMAPVRKKVDDSRAVLQRLAAGADAGAFPGAAAVLAELGKLDALAATRSQVDAGNAPRAGTFDFFTSHITALNGIDFALDRSTDRTLRRAVDALSALAGAKEYLTQERAFLNGVFSAGGFRKGEYNQFAAMYAAAHEAENQFARVATAAQLARSAGVRATGAYGEALEFENRALASADDRPLLINPQSWWSALTTVLDDIRALEESIGADIRERAAAVRAGATERLAILGGLVLLCLVGAVALVAAAVRSITRPLAMLAREAEAVATQRLPEAVFHAQQGRDEQAPDPPPAVVVPRRASAEVHSVAAALDRVQTTAWTLATEQALLRRNTTESLANLGRRNQSLVRRQLGFISRLESEENDPAGLANLFELDHLATRMRRNAESLLVLVGEDSPRPWSSAMAISDVIRAAISEVEDYRRVTLRRIDEGYVAGAFVTGVAHMVAELVENGLTFSPPDVDVEIQGRNFGDRYLIAIIDQGVGMPPEELETANGRLRGSDTFLMAPARFLGHYVVGQLAGQLGVDVELSNSPVTGVTARVMLPARLLTTPPPIEGPREPPGRLRPPASVSAQLVLGTRPVPVVEYVSVPGATVSGTVVAEDDRTRNGLRKRPARRPAGAAVIPAPASDPDPVRSPAVDDSPAHVRDRLLSLRDGFQRNERDRGERGEDAR